MSLENKGQEYEEFGNRLQWLRDEAGLSQRDLAEKLGMPQQTYQGYESGARKVTLQLLRQFADYFDVSIDFLAGRTKDRKLHKSEELHDQFDNKNIQVSSDEETALSLYRQLDFEDKCEIRGEMKGILKAEKYDSIKKESKNA
jgi:transcriptional regulator with XRE-family HTH domain